MKLYGTVAVHVQAVDILRAPGFLDKLRRAFGGKPDLRTGNMRSAIEATALVEASRDALRKLGATDAISLVNTFVAMAIDAETRKPRISNITAGLSGPAIKPIALRMVYEAAHSVDIPVIGMGGITTGTDAVEFLLAGAAAVEVGTASYFDPSATERIVSDLERWCLDHRVKAVTDLIGALDEKL